MIFATSERSLLIVLSPAANCGRTLNSLFKPRQPSYRLQLPLPMHLVERELDAIQPISFAAASNRRVIGSNEFV
jgi:hypothetical protein